MVICVAIRKLLLPYGRKQDSYRMCTKIKKYVKVLLLEFWNEDHILYFFLLCKDFFDRLYMIKMYVMKLNLKTIRLH